MLKNVSIFVLDVIVPSKAQKATDIEMSMYIAMHSSIRSIDHLGELLGKWGKGSVLENLHLHRSKCSSIILHILSPEILKTIVEDIGDGGFSIILDESTDVSHEKYMAYCVRYYSKTEGAIIITGESNVRGFKDQRRMFEISALNARKNSKSIPIPKWSICRLHCAMYKAHDVIRKNDIELAKNDTFVLVVEFDYGQNHLIPKVNVNSQFYKKLLWLYVFNAHGLMFGI